MIAKNINNLIFRQLIYNYCTKVESCGVHIRRQSSKNWNSKVCWSKIALKGEKSIHSNASYNVYVYKDNSKRIFMI